MISERPASLGRESSLAPKSPTARLLAPGVCASTSEMDGASFVSALSEVKEASFARPPVRLAASHWCVSRVVGFPRRVVVFEHRSASRFRGARAGARRASPRASTPGALSHPFAFKSAVSTSTLFFQRSFPPFSAPFARVARRLCERIFDDKEKKVPLPCGKLRRVPWYRCERRARRRRTTSGTWRRCCSAAHRL